MITLTFKSGDLWHGEYQVVNPEVIPGFKRLKDVWQVISNESLKNVLKDGDQITLPEGYGIKNNLQWHPVGCEGKWQNTNEYYFDTVQFPCGKRRAATITLPEKTENSAHGQHCGGLNCPAFEYACADVCMRPIIKEPVSEPSESQEETPAVPWRIEVRPKGWGPSTVMFDANDNCVMYEHSPNIAIWTIIVDAVNQKYTRK